MIWDGGILCTYLFRKDKILSLVFSIKGKHYSDRPAQDSAGEFTSVKMNLKDNISIGGLWVDENWHTDILVQK